MKLCPQCTTGYPDSANTCPTHGGILSEIRDLKPGMVIRRTYLIERKLGQGGMGSVYLARHTLMDEPRALKFLASEYSSDQAFTSRFLREVRTLRQVRHRNVVDCGDLEPAEDDSLFFPMEFVDGPDLREFLRVARRPFDVEMALEIARGIALGLGAAHALGLVHRDIKPENILMARVGDSYTPKIADFGIVATRESSRTHLTTGRSLLTPPYAAPEQWRGMRAAELDGRTDLYALGGVLFEMLTGQTVFEAESYEGWAEEHKNTPPRPPSSLRPDLAKWKGLDALVLRLLAKDREQRPRDVAEFLSWLGMVKHVVPPTRPATVEEPPLRAQTILETQLAKGGGTETVEANAPEWEQPSQRKRFFWLGPALIVAVVLLVMFLSWQENRNRTPGPVIDSAAQQPMNSQPQKDANDAPARQPVQAKPDRAAIERQAVALFKRERYEAAAPLLEQACAAGNAEACSDLGFMYEFNEGVAQDYPRAVALYTKGCAAGSSAGCDELGLMYENEIGVTRNFSQAVTLFSKACDAGDVRGCAYLGGLYWHGNGVEQNYQMAAKLNQRACDGGYAASCGWLGELYRDGNGVSKDTEKARELLNEACSKGAEFACDEAKQLQ
jgi:eukaryotic-like serine/threonine-protein kinase